VEITDVSHESIIRSLDRNTSTARTSYHESTMLPFRCVEIHEQCCDSSTDLAERATFECSSAIPHLRSNIRFFASLVNNGTLRDNSRFDLLMSLEIFCISSTTCQITLIA
jgi:hypothetical protein